MLIAPISACSSDEESSSSSTADSAEGSHAEGKNHEEGKTPNRVTLNPTAYQTANIRVESVHPASGQAGAEDLEVPGQVEFDPRRVALISSRAPGRIERLLVVEGDRVEAGQTVALLYSSSHVTAQNDFLQAIRRARLLTGTADEQGANSLAEAARRRLRTLGVGNEEITRLEGGGEPASFLALTAPFAGSIMEAHALLGAAVESGQQIFKIADLSVVDVVAEVPERALPLVRIGQGASIGIAAYPTMRFAGQVERLRDELNPETRTVRAVIHVSNSSARLRPGMFATVRLLVPSVTVARATGATPGDADLLTIPESAVVAEGERQYVFVEVGERTFERREVQTASLAPPGSATPGGDRVVVNRGLIAGDRVVVNGAFILKSELAKTGLGEHGH
ncbi:MAG: efflux RND transporter periplasmic adaptor subunit [Gemmatimonadaceae bacterium]